MKEVAMDADGPPVGVGCIVVTGPTVPAAAPILAYQEPVITDRGDRM